MAIKQTNNKCAYLSAKNCKTKSMENCKLQTKTQKNSQWNESTFKQQYIKSTHWKQNIIDY